MRSRRSTMRLARPSGRSELALAIEGTTIRAPLAGVPVSVKDILDVAGLPTRWGSPLMADAKPAVGGYRSGRAPAGGRRHHHRQDHHQ